MKKQEYLPSESDVNFFREKGYWKSKEIVSEDRLERYREHMELVYNGEFETGRTPWKGYWEPESSKQLRKTDNAHWSDTVIRELATDPVIGEIAATLLQVSEIRLWHDQLLYKPGKNTRKSQANVGWHQDYSYWQCCAEPNLITAWVAFDDVDLSNGCMQVVPGSHTWGLLNVNDFFEQDITKQEASIVRSEGRTFDKVPMILKAGEVSFHHSLTIHGSGPNMTEKPRRSLAIHLMAGGMKYQAGTRADDHMNVHILQPKDGDEFTGENFPVLYSHWG